MGVEGAAKATCQDQVRQGAYAQGYQDGQAFRASPVYQDALSAEGVVIETLTARGKRTTFKFAATDQSLENL